jgi:hypothetical protein
LSSGVDKVVERDDGDVERVDKFVDRDDDVIERVDEIVERDDEFRGNATERPTKWPTGRQSGEGKNGVASVTSEWCFKDGVVNALRECLRGRMRAVSRTATLSFHL